LNEQIKSIEPATVTDAIMPLDGALDNSADILLLSLKYFCARHNLPYSKPRALNGIPSENRILNANNYARAAQNLGLLAKAVKTKPSSVSKMVFPFLVFFREGSIGIVESRSDKNQFDILISNRQGNWDKRSVSPEQLDKHATDTVFYVTQLANSTAFSLDAKKSEKHWFWSKVRRFWPSWSYAVLATFVLNLLGLALPLFVMNVYDRVIPNNSISTLWALAIGVSVALVFDLVLKILRSAMIDNSSKRIDLGVSAEVFEHALDVKMQQRPGQSGELANHIREFESVREFFSSGAITSLIDLLFIGVFLGFLWFIVGPLVVVPLLAVPIVLIVTMIVQVPLTKAISESQSASGNRHSILVESLVSIETVKSISAEGALQKRWEDSVAVSARAGATTRFWSTLAVYFTMFAQQAVSVLVIVWGVFLVASGDITIGALIAANILAGRILAPLGGISGTLVRAQQSFAALAKLNALMKLDRDNPKQRGHNASIDSGAIEFRDVEFTYPGQLEPTLSGLSFRITPGERIGIIGRVGSGKSTIGKLLGGLYSPASGGVLVDSTDARHLNMSDIRENIVYVGQETELFTGSLRENVLIAKPEHEDRLKSCLIGAGVAAFASRHPLGLEMPVGERGKSLSGGQRQSVGIARAMLAAPKIMFLDEPTAQMDTLTEATFSRSFSDWLNSDTTLVLATHRNTLLELVDRIIVIEDGKLVADGPKAEILGSLNKKSKVSADRKEKNHAGR